MCVGSCFLCIPNLESLLIFDTAMDSSCNFSSKWLAHIVCSISISLDLIDKLGLVLKFPSFSHKHLSHLMKFGNDVFNVWLEHEKYKLH